MPVPTSDILRAKWSAEVYDEGFIPFPKRLIRCLGTIFQGEYAVQDLQSVLAIIDYARPNLTRHPSYQFLAFTAGLEVATLKKRVLAMEARGLLKVVGPDEAVAIDATGLMKKIEEATAESSAF